MNNVMAKLLARTLDWVLDCVLEEISYSESDKVFAERVDKVMDRVLGHWIIYWIGQRIGIGYCIMY